MTDPRFKFDGKCVTGFKTPVVLERKDEYGKPCASGVLLAGLLDSAFTLGVAHGRYPDAAALSALERRMLTADAATDAKALDRLAADAGIPDHDLSELSDHDKSEPLGSAQDQDDIGLPPNDEQVDQRQREFIGSHDDLQPVRKGGEPQ